MKGISIEERATKLAHYIIESKKHSKNFWNKQKHSTQRRFRKTVKN